MEASRLLKERQALGLSREHVARLLDPPVTSETIRRWERGSAVKPYRLRQLAAIYGLEVEPNGVAA